MAQATMILTQELKVLVVSPVALPGGSDDWSRVREGGAGIAMVREQTLEEAHRRLERDPADAIILDARLAAEDGAAVAGLREGSSGAPVLVLGGDEIERMMEIPPGSPDRPHLLAQLVHTAVDRARLAARLEQSEHRFRDVIERTADAILVVDPEGAIQFANTAAERLFAKPRRDLIGTQLGFPLVAGETTEVDLPRGDDTPLVAEMRVVGSEWEGAPACIASLRDVTKRREAELNARQLISEQAARTVAEASARRFRFLADSSTTLSSSLDYGHTLAALAKLCATEMADWVVVYVVGEGGAVGRLEVAHCDPEMEHLVRAMRRHPIDPDGPHPVHEVLRTREPLLEREVDEDRMESLAQDDRHLALIRELGMRSYMLLPMVARERAIGAIALVSAGDTFDEEDVALAQDLALRAALAVDNARLYQEAQRANEEKTQLLAVISHDLRTPLSSIIGYSDLLSMGVPETLGEGSLQQVDRIRVGAKHLLYLIEELLAFARLDSGRDGLQIQSVPVREIVAEVANVMEPLALEGGLEFHVDVPEERITLQTDPGKLRQVLVNLTANALKFTEEGEVRLRAWAEDGTVVFQVVDSGVGIGPEHLEQIFQPFWQVTDTRGANGSGTGLGLSVVQRLVAALGGDVSVDSIVGDGSTFTVRLPRYAMEPAEATEGRRTDDQLERRG